MVSPDCSADFGFAGKTFISAHCVGNGKTETDASLFMVPDVASPVPVQLVNGNAAAGALRPSWSPDKAGTKVLVFARQNSRARVVPVSANPTIVNIENAAEEGFLSDDGGKVFYRTTANAFRSANTTNNATPANPPASAVTLVADGGLAALLGTSKDKAHVLFRKLPPVGAQGEVPRLDLNLADTVTAAQAPTVIAATATAFPVGFTATSSHVIYLTDVTPQGIGKLKVRPVAAGGVERQVAAVAGLARPLPTGSKAVFFDNLKPLGQGVVVDVKVFDAAGTAAPAVVASGAEPFYEVFGTKLVYVRPAAGAGAGLYAADIP